VNAKGVAAEESANLYKNVLSPSMMMMAANNNDNLSVASSITNY